MSEHRKPPPARHGRKIDRGSLLTLSGILAEMARVYRRAKAGTLDHEQARSLTWMLSQMRAAAEALELERLHERLDDMAATLTLEAENGYLPRQNSPALLEDRRN